MRNETSIPLRSHLGISYEACELSIGMSPAVEEKSSQLSFSSQKVQQGQQQVWEIKVL
jgi:hypothetical protein